MTEMQDKLVKAIAKLIKLTQTGNLIWESGKPRAEMERDDFKVESIFISRYKDRTLRLYKHSYRIDQPGYFDFSSAILGRPPKYPYWASSIILEFIDDNGLSLWKFPYSSALIDLFQAVQYQVAGVDEFLDTILKE